MQPQSSLQLFLSLVVSAWALGLLASGVIGFCFKKKTLDWYLTVSQETVLKLTKLVFVSPVTWAWDKHKKFLIGVVVGIIIVFYYLNA